MTEEKKEKESSKGVSRREFITGTVGGVVVGAAATAAAGSLGLPRTVQAAAQIAKQPSLDQSSFPASEGSGMPTSWDLSADVVIIGSGASGMPAALAARAQGASVIVVEANYDVGGHSIVSGGAVPLGGGTAAQIKAGITDSPNLLFQDLTDWSIVEPNGWPDYRYNDRGFIRALADNSVATYNLVVANGVVFGAPSTSGRDTGNSVPRTMSPTYTGPANLYSPNATGGGAFIRPLEASARKLGIQFLLNYHMDSIVRTGGRVVGVVAHYTGGRIPPGTGTPLVGYADSQSPTMPGTIKMTQAEVNIWANKGVILCTGGHSSNVNFRRIFDVRQTSQYQVAGEPYSFQDASGELAGIAVGASLWGTVNQSLEMGNNFCFKDCIGARYNYSVWQPTSPVFAFAGGSGITVSNWQDVILVNQVGQRIFNEMVGSLSTNGQYPNGNVAGGVKPYTPDSYLNSQYITSSAAPGSPFDANDFNLNNAAAAINAFSQPPDYSAGPLWAIFDSAAVTREKWTVTYPSVDTANGYFFSAPDLNTLAAATIGNPYQAAPMDGPTLSATVARYNSFVTSGVDTDFGKPKPAYQINTPPYYAAWSTSLAHDTRAGLRISQKMEVVDWSGNVIPGLYCAGETAGGINQHGNGRCAVGGYIAGVNAAGGTTPTT